MLAVEEFVDTDVVEILHPMQSVDVEMRDRYGARVLVHERERGRTHRRAAPERRHRARYEGGLAATEITGEHDDITGDEYRRDRGRNPLRLGSRCSRDAHGGTHRSDASRRLTTTKSARASAKARPPLRSTADGCNVGTSTASTPARS